MMNRSLQDKRYGSRQVKTPVEGGAMVEGVTKVATEFTKDAITDGMIKKYKDYKKPMKLGNK